MIYGEAFKNQSRKSEKDFTRNRKIRFVPLICMLLRMIRKSTQLELDEFREIFLPESAETTSYTKQSFSEARQKLSPIAFTLLNDEIIRGFYADDDFKTYKGFRLLAIDGSVMEIPNTKEMQQTYGYIRNYKEGFKAARARSSHLFDLENKIAISTCLTRYDDNERNLAKQNIEKLLSFEQSHIPNLILFDRGYPSADFILYLQEKGLKYVMRSQHCFYKEVENTTSLDEAVRIEVTKERAKALKRQGTPIKKGTVLEVRVLKVELPTGEIEILLTNLGVDELSHEESKSLYFKRWGIETRFNELKHKFEIENFSGEKPILIEQDFYATVFLSNIASIFEQEAEAELQEKNKGKTLKYEEYRINKNILIGKLRNRLIHMILEEDARKKDILYERFLKELQRNIVPVRKNRAFKRDKQSRANRYAKSKRRSL
ncbi:DDE family transposase [Aneurinibacillus soli]|uniref:Transposase DDE domain protein n=1 Tax=Aneurinibacillus soli TaxID=1500254 RepID=A0A0U5BI92_9BACL|nr:IS4 family transposase [Aneurinibacillus soli]PYE56911.1 DDE family transposase [Aneurinibacillus soli]BAU26919.1 Transposase DDE domain protein [Aneurinibacillus soli]BAU27870.1 Transposase DDE domain protein [Aneurinibacillus soli]